MIVVAIALSAVAAPILPLYIGTPIGLAGFLMIDTTAFP